MVSKYIIIILALLVTTSCSCNDSLKSNEGINALLLPAVLASLGYILKTLYQTLATRSRNKREALESKLRQFYWPILTRLEQNSAIWEFILSKHDKYNVLEKNIGEYVESNIIMKNHREIISIIIDSRYQAKFDSELSDQLKEYFRHVAKYEGIINSKDKTLPGLIGAPYPDKFDEIIKNSTIKIQKKLDKKWIL
jgi:hypothetical protein